MDRTVTEDAHEQHILTAAHIEILFGTGSLDEIFEELDTDDSGYVCIQYNRVMFVHFLCHLAFSKVSEYHKD